MKIVEINKKFKRVSKDIWFFDKKNFSDFDADIITKMHMIPAKSLTEAVDMAKKLLDKENITITAIPDGVSVVVVE